MTSKIWVSHRRNNRWEKYQGSKRKRWKSKEPTTTSCHKYHPKFANKGLYSQSYGFSSSYVWIWELDHKEGWVPKNWCFLSVVLKRTLESPLDSKEIKPVNPKGNQPWIFIGSTDAEAKAPILWPPDLRSWLTGKDPDAGKDWGHEEKGLTEDEMAGWFHQLNGHSLSKFKEVVKDREAWHASVHEAAKNEKQLSNWTTTTTKNKLQWSSDFSTEQEPWCIYTETLNAWHNLVHSGHAKSIY